jgi:tetratricopeptide (TPR) repeat protein
MQVGGCFGARFWYRLRRSLMRTQKASLRVLLAMTTVMAFAGCQELDSRREIQKGNKLYMEGRYQQAIEKFEAALAGTPDLAIGHHNAGLSYYKLFQPGVDTPENKVYAQKAADHFAAYLQDEQDDRKVISLLTTIWMDSEQFDKAVAYWSAVLAKDPKAVDVIEKLANIHRQAGQYDKAVEWHQKRIALETETGGKVKGYLDIAQMHLGRLFKQELFDAERLAVVDAGLAALQEAEKLDPSLPLVQSLQAAMYQHRALAHQATWARGLEAASQRYHGVRFTELSRAQQPKAGASPAPGAPQPSAAPPVKK